MLLLDQIVAFFLRPKGILLAISLLAMSLFTAYGLGKPQSPAGHLLFHAGYFFSPARPAFLRFYRWGIAGNFHPADIDGYLIARISHCEGSREEDAILDFEIRRGSYRWGDAAASPAYESFQGQMIGNVISRLDDFSGTDSKSAMLFIESLRRQDSLSESQLLGMGKNEEDAKQHFKTWWQNGSRWPEIRKIDPLAGASVHVESGP